MEREWVEQKVPCLREAGKKGERRGRVLRLLSRHSSKFTEKLATSPTS